MQYFQQLHVWARMLNNQLRETLFNDGNLNDETYEAMLRNFEIELFQIDLLAQI